MRRPSATWVVSPPSASTVPMWMAHPAARARCSSSAPYRSRSSSRPRGPKSIQAQARSVAGSPPVMSPQSIRPATMPSRSTTFRGCRSPWIHTVAPAGWAASARLQRSSTVRGGVRRRSRSSTASLLPVSGPPRNGFRGASAGEGRCRRLRVRARRSTCVSGRALPSAALPRIHVTTLQGHGNSSDGVPNATGTGTGTGNRAAIVGSHCCSFRRFCTATSRRGIRNACSVPRRKT